MRIDVVIGNPPYQEMTGGNQVGGKALWHRFIELAKDINAIYITFITPSRWFTGGQGLNQFRLEWMKDKHIKQVVHFPDANIIFPGTSIAGGVSYFLWDLNSYQNSVQFTNTKLNETYEKKLDQFDVVITDKLSESITEKVVAHIKNNELLDFGKIVGGIGEYGLPRNLKFTEGDIEVITSTGIFKCNKEDLKSIQDLDKYKVVVSSTSCEHAGESDKNGMYKVLTTISLAGVNQVFAGHYIKVASFDSIAYAYRCMKYIKTRLVRLLLNIRKVGIGFTKDSYKFVPIQDFTDNSDIDWSQSISDIEQQLYKKYELTQDEIDYIEKTIKPMN